ncbi:hypothetical protein C3F09_09780 [candidate division GN15 bacterium]|uniref:DUF1772 domain-containing protein n=1 Tax=candidate division GN15 bacterium TaxID=2072418 RepID=A0A855X4Q1_9BACT|nr:MAG: hypothetical protein C3F09_09780 [candidate division GN15 bacterium]
MLITLMSFLALVSTGFLSGILLGNRLGASFALPRLPDSAFVQFQQAVHRNYVRFMPVLQIMAILSHGWLLLLLRNSAHPTALALFSFAAAGSVIVFAITLTVNVPVNKKLMTWAVSNPPHNARELWRPWDKGNTVRTVFAITVFVLDVLAICLTMPRIF